MSHHDSSALLLAATESANIVPRNCPPFSTESTQCMVRPCVARELCRVGGERSCINVSGLLLERWLLAIMDISARAISLADRSQPDHLGHQCSHAPGRPNLHLVSSSRRPR